MACCCLLVRLPLHSLSIPLLSMVGSITYARLVLMWGLAILAGLFLPACVMPPPAARFTVDAPSGCFRGLCLPKSRVYQSASWRRVGWFAAQPGHPYIATLTASRSHAYQVNSGTFVLGICGVFCIPSLHNHQLGRFPWTSPVAFRTNAGVFLVCIPAAQPLEGRKGRCYNVHRWLESQDRVDLHLQICTLLFRCTAPCCICSVACTPVCLYAQRSLSCTAFTA